MSKYQRWHDQIVERSRKRKPLGCYYETHHLQPRSLGGSDCASNLVQLTYREHFLIHWLLTKVNSGASLRKMQRAMLALTMPLGERQIFEWQFAVARRAVQDLAVDPVKEDAWRRNFSLQALMNEDVKRKREAKWVRDRTKIRNNNRRLVHEIVSTTSSIDRSELNRLTNLFLRHSGKPKVKYSFRPKRVLGPDGKAISLQKLRLKQKLASDTPIL
jgi:hypothetical protein